MSLVLEFCVAVVAALFFAWLVGRAARARRPLLRWPGLLLSGLLAAVCASVVALGLVGVGKLGASHPGSVPTLTVASTPERVARGERLAHLCVACHSSTGNFPLDGGRENFAQGIGTLYAPNLTPAGPLSAWSDGEIVRALRQGVNKDGRALSIMPSEEYRGLSDEDAAALVAYLRAQPPIARDLPAKRLNLVGAVLFGVGVYPSSFQEPLAAPVTAPLRAPTPEYGRYLVTVAGCATCHGEGLTGGTPNPFVPAGPSLLTSAAWSEADFARAMRSGVTPSGRVLDPEEMPWKDLGKVFEDDDLRAIRAYLQGLAADVAAAGDTPLVDATRSGEGGRLYAAHCAGCHGEAGEGGAGPALAGNDRLGNSAFMIERLLNGRGAMPAWEGVLSDEQLAAVGSFVRTSFGNDFGPLTTSDVAGHE